MHGTLACWGKNDSGPATPPTGTFTQVSAGGNHNCAVRTDGALACWGDNTYRKATPPNGTFSEGGTIGLALVITGLAVLGKLVACGMGGYGLGKRSMLILGVGMVPRGEIGFVVASVALTQGAIGMNVFSSVVFMSIATTLVVPPVLSILYGRSRALEIDGGRC